MGRSAHETRSPPPPLTSTPALLITMLLFTYPLPCAPQQDNKLGLTNSSASADIDLVRRFYAAVDTVDADTLRALTTPGYRAIFAPGCSVVGAALHEGEEALDVDGLVQLLQVYREHGMEADEIGEATETSRRLISEGSGVVVNHYSHSIADEAHDAGVAGGGEELHGAAVHELSSGGGQLSASFWYGGAQSCRGYSTRGYAVEWLRTSSESATSSLFLGLVMALIAVAITLDAVLRKRGVLWLPGCVSTMLLGLALGSALHYGLDNPQLESLLEFDAALFVLILLPMIIFEAGYSLDKRGFFTHIRTIATLAVFGTLICALLLAPVIFLVASASFGSVEEAAVRGQRVEADGSISRPLFSLVTPFSYAESLAYAALLSAIDPVATIAIFRSLGVARSTSIILLGESLLNDAVAIVLYRTAADTVGSLADGSAGRSLLYMGGLPWLWHVFWGFSRCGFASSPPSPPLA
eukprot:COSAG05_NODE_259_length_12737_cov_42.436145_4_plen_468_part_00